MNRDEHINELARAARSGDKAALEELIRAIRSSIFNLSLRMLGFSADVEDAVQEILIKTITHLVDFKGDSRFTTWSYRIAVNHLLTIKKTRARDQEFTFENWEDLGRRNNPDFDYDGLPEPDKTLLTEEVRIGCMQGMLQCLEKKERIAFILGEILEITDSEASEILSISRETFRKRLSRGRARLTEFMRKNCGLVNPDNSCRCASLVGPDIRDQWIDPDNLHFVGSQCRAKINAHVRESLKEMGEIERALYMFRSYPEYADPGSTGTLIRDLIDSGRYEILCH